MPQAVAHILFPLLIMSLVRDALPKRDKRSFPLHYVLIAGIAGIIPDLDIAAFWVLHFFGFTFSEVHKTFAHSMFLPIILFALFFVFRKTNIPEFGKHKLQIGVIFLMLSFGIFVHLLLDAIVGFNVLLLYPFSSVDIGINLFGLLSSPLNSLAAPSLDAALFIIYIIYLELRHKISDFI